MDHDHRWSITSQNTKERIGDGSACLKENVGILWDIEIFILDTHSSKWIYIQINPNTFKSFKYIQIYHPQSFIQNIPKQHVDQSIPKELALHPMPGLSLVKIQQTKRGAHPNDHEWTRPSICSSLFVIHVVKTYSRDWTSVQMRFWRLEPHQVWDAFNFIRVTT